MTQQLPRILFDYFSDAPQTMCTPLDRELNHANFCDKVDKLLPSAKLVDQFPDANLPQTQWEIWEIADMTVIIHRWHQPIYYTTTVNFHKILMY